MQQDKLTTAPRPPIAELTAALLPTVIDHTERYPGHEGMSTAISALASIVADLIAVYPADERAGMVERLGFAVGELAEQLAESEAAEAVRPPASH